VASLVEGREMGERVLKEVFDRPFDSGHGKLHLSASIGVALGDREVSPDRLLADADTAMYLRQSLEVVAASSCSTSPCAPR
jgi:PleD family two-component response regulator